MSRILFNTLCPLVLFVLMTSCESVSSSSRFYRPLTSQTYPPKAKDYKVVILGAAPKQKHEVIGRLSFSAGHGYSYMIKAIEYNARQAGADAAIMLKSSSETHQYTYQVPGYTTTEPIVTRSNSTAYGSANIYGTGYSAYGTGSAYGTSTSTTYVPVYHEGYTGVGTSTRHTIDAVMIVYK